MSCPELGGLCPSWLQHHHAVSYHALLWRVTGVLFYAQFWCATGFSQFWYATGVSLYPQFWYATGTSFHAVFWCAKQVLAGLLGAAALAGARPALAADIFDDRKVRQNGFDIIYEARDLDLPQNVRDGMTQVRAWGVPLPQELPGPLQNPEPHSTTLH